jgi:hypothetical protein
LQNAGLTLHDFVLKLLTEAPSRAAFDADPVAALRDAGLDDVSPQDVVDAIPLVLDFASASGRDLDFGGAFSGGTDGFVGAAAFNSGHGDVQFGLTGSLDGIAAAVQTDTPVAAGGYDVTAGPHGFTTGGGLDLRALDALGLDSDSIGRGGDLVTGTVAGYLNDGADTLAGVLTEGMDTVSDGVDDGAEMVTDVVDDGTDMVSEGLDDVTDTVGDLAEDGRPHLSELVPTPADLPVDVPSGLPQLPLDLGDLPVDLPLDLPPLPGVPAVPGLPEVPVLPSTPSVPVVGDVTDVVGGVTGNIPVVSDLTDGLGDGLLGN